MLTLGKDHVRVVTDADGATARVVYRDAKTEEWAAFQGEMAEMVAGKLPGERLSTLCHKYGSLIVVKVEGFDVPDGMTQEAALCEFAPDIVAEIGALMFVQGGGRKIDLGKFGRLPASSSKGESARSSNELANT